MIDFDHVKEAFLKPKNFVAQSDPIYFNLPTWVMRLFKFKLILKTLNEILDHQY